VGPCLNDEAQKIFFGWSGDEIIFINDASRRD